MFWLSLLFLLVLCLIADYFWKRDVNAKWSGLPGPLNLPIIGCIWLYTHVHPDDLGIKRQALLDVSLSATINGQPLTDTDIREEVYTFMFEGHDTTKSGIAFTLYCISRNVDVQSKLYAEIIEVLGTNMQHALAQRQLMQLKYTELVIKEALRMYPLVPYVGRALNGNCIPKGSSVILAIYEVQNDTAYFPQPQRFLPEREVHENPFAFVPFSAGPRNCNAQRFAMLEMKAFIARIIQIFELLPLGADVEPTVRVVLKSKTGWQIGFRNRNIVLTHIINKIKFVN